MGTPDTTAVKGRSRQLLPARWSIMAPMALFAIGLLLRVLDIYVFRLDERLGEIILSKSLGFALVIGYTWWVGQSLAAIGLHARRVGPALAIGGGITVAAFVIGGIAQVFTFNQGEMLVFQAVDPKTGLSGGAAFAVFLVTGNVINGFMEEGLFRGIMLPHFLQRMSFRAANLLQAVLFASWHLVWPIKAYLTGETSAAGAVGEASLLVLGTFIAASIYGFLFWRTDSLWAPWFAHFLNNTILNFVQVQDIGGQLQPPMVMSVVVVAVIIILAFAIGPIGKRLGLKQLGPWGTSRSELTDYYAEV